MRFPFLVRFSQVTFVGLTPVTAPPTGTGAPMNWPRAIGPVPTDTVAMTVRVVVSMTDTVLSRRFAT